MIRLKALVSRFAVLAATAATAFAQNQSMTGSSGNSIRTEGGGLALPEPITMTLVALGAGGVTMAVARHRKQKRARRERSQLS